ncbi:hypothetical protein VP01_394g3 [Puccinia sorghi]|uniref:Tc1-like transposase DDE domain-containing protein n=1 Tax=Puccinia sorghi TaxID=27349 RepID=A0A0L6USD2_9BASI|nr:hypothetical protein VP01_394g3 [Puccinia sorghi]
MFGHRPAPIRVSHPADSLQPHLKKINIQKWKEASQCCQNICHILPTSAKSKLKTDVITSVMLLLKETPSTTLKKLAEHVKNEFNIQVSPGAIQKTLKNIEVTWKRSGFNSDTCPSHGYSLSVKAATLKTNARGSLINLIDGKKKTGATSIDICNFLVCLQDHCPAQLIIIMDNTRICGADNFERVKNLLKESTKKINIEFLPKNKITIQDGRRDLSSHQ